MLLNNALKNKEVVIFKMTADLELGKINVTLTCLGFENITSWFSNVKYLYFAFEIMTIALKNTEVLIFKMAADLDFG